MNLATRRRLALGAAATSVALVAGLVIAPQVLAAAGDLTISPSGAQNNETKELTFTGKDADFEFGATATFSRLGAQNFTVVTPDAQPPTGKQTTGKKTVDFNDVGDGLNSDGPADAGSYNVSVTGDPNPITGSPLPGPGGGTDSCASCFTVLPTGPLTVTSVTPNAIRPGNKDNITVAGTGFERSSKLEFLLPDGSPDGAITLTLPTASAGCTGTVSNGDDITTRTAIKRCATLTAGATPGARDVRVTNLDGSSFTCDDCFFVAGPALTSVNPTAAFNDPTQGPTAVTFSGPNVTNGTPSLEYVGPTAGAAKSEISLVGTNVRDYTGTSITADFDFRNAAPAAYQPFVRGSDGIVNACDNCRFTVVQRSERTPTLTSMDSDTATAGIQKDIKPGETKTFDVVGTNFSKGALVTLDPPAGLTVTNVTFVSPEQLRATITAASNAGVGAKNAQVKLTDGKTSNTCTGCVSVVAASPSPSPSRSATPTATASPSPQGCPSTPVTVRVNTRTINATGRASVTVTGATPSATIELQGYSQNHEGTMTFEKDPTPIDRVGTADANGAVTFSDLRPASNTRVRARQKGCTFGNSQVIEVRAQETLEVRRVGDRTYVFSGRSIPAREGGLIISLYRIVGAACQPGVEPRNCPGERLIGQGRAQALGAANEGLYSIRITFPARDENVRDEFVVKTGRDAQNAPGRSNARSLLIN